MLKRSQNPSAVYVALCLAVVAVCALAVVAQSGRRERKPESSPVPLPTPEATASPTPTEKPKPTLTFIVGTDRNADILLMSLSTYGSVLRNCAERLGDSLAVKAEVGSQDLSRSDAVRQAKEEKETYIVWLQLRRDTARTPNGETDNIYIQYTVFAPTTAKQVTFGSIFPEAYRNKRVRVPTPTSDGDYYLNQAARGAAERILDHFHLRPAK